MLSDVKYAVGGSLIAITGCSEQLPTENFKVNTELGVVVLCRGFKQTAFKLDSRWFS